MKFILRPLALLILFLFLTKITILAWIGVIIMLLDMRSRFEEWDRFRSTLPTEQKFKLLERSWCSRGVAETVWPSSTGYYKRKGHKWWHIFPVGTPEVWATKEFWLSIIRPTSLK